MNEVNFQVGDLVKVKEGIFTPVSIEKYGIGVVIEIENSKALDPVKVYWNSFKSSGRYAPGALVKVND